MACLPRRRVWAVRRKGEGVMSGHTPGPWLTNGTAGHEKHGQWSVYAESGKTIAIVYDGERDANLIAAAPQLLEACQRLVSFADGKVSHVDWAVENARAAIAKAEGMA